MRTLFPAAAVLFAVVSGAGRAPTTPPRILQLEARVDALERALEDHKEASSLCHELIPLLVEEHDAQLAEIRRAVNRLHGMSSPFAMNSEPSVGLSIATSQNCKPSGAHSPPRRDGGGPK